MSLIKFFIERKVTTFMLSFGIFLLGLFCMNKTSIDLFPPVHLPTLMVAIGAPGFSSQDVEQKIINPLEEVLNTLPALEKMRSESKSNQALFLLKFEWGTSIDFAALSTREVLKTIALPSEAHTPLIYRWDPSEDPILRADLSSPLGIEALTELAENKIRPRLERLKGVATIEIGGGVHSEVQVQFDPETLASRGLSLTHLSQLFKQENIKKQIGAFEEGRYELALKLNSEFKSLEEIQNLPVSLPVSLIERSEASKHTLPLKDIAHIQFSLEERKTLARVSGEESVSLNIKKAHHAATLDVIRAVKKELAFVTKENPALRVTYSKDDSLYIQTSRSILWNNFWQGSVLTFIVVLLFLKSWAATLIISITIPISIMGTFALMQYFGISQNVFSLAGFTLAAGMVVDSSTVILENIYRHFKEEGKSAWRAAVEGTQEVWLGVIASTITTMVIFIPVVYCIKGIFGVLFKDIAFTFIVSMGLSLVIGFSLIPCLCALLLKRGEENLKHPPLRIPWLDTLGFKTQKFLLALLSYFLNAPKKAALALLVTYAFSFGCIFLLPGLDLLPLGEFKNFMIRLKGKAGTHLDYTHQKTSQLEHMLQIHPEIETLATSVQEEEAQLYATLKKGIFSEKKAQHYLENLRQSLHLPDMELKILDVPKLDTTEGYATPFALILKHPDPRIRKDILLQLTESFKSIPDLLYLSSSEEKTKPELHIHLDFERLKDHGLTAEYISQLVYGHMTGIKSTQFQDKDILISEERETKASFQDLKNLPILTQNKTLPLYTFAELQEKTSEQTISHTDHIPSTALYGYLKTDRRSLEDILKDVRTVIEQKPAWATHISIESTLKVFKETFSDLFIALLIAIILVYMILAAQFESLAQPITLIFSLPLAALGVLVGVTLWGLYLHVIVMVGIILLVGITCDSGILIIEYINILRSRGMDRNEAILTAVKHRMRPIFITAITDIVGTAPMAFSTGAGAEMYQGFGVVTMFGLTSALFLTLLVTPLMYVWMEDFYEFFQLKLLWIQVTFFKKEAL